MTDTPRLSIEPQGSPLTIHCAECMCAWTVPPHSEKVECTTCGAEALVSFLRELQRSRKPRNIDLDIPGIAQIIRRG